jgi:hypothetical protein
MADSTTSNISWPLIAYIFICLALGLGTFRALSNSERFWGAIIALILFILIFVFFGLRWFTGTNTVFTYAGAWPPIINMCPDYLVYFKKGTVDSCIDMLGVSTKPGILLPWTQEDTPSNPPQNPSKYFMSVYKPGMTPDQLKKLCADTMVAGLSWEGITNGDSCTFPEAKPIVPT